MAGTHEAELATATLAISSPSLITFSPSSLSFALSHLSGLLRSSHLRRRVILETVYSLLAGPGRTQSTEYTPQSLPGTLFSYYLDECKSNFSNPHTSLANMDGAASIIAFVLLAIQLIQSVDTVRTFVRDVKGASKELERLVELLDRLSALLQDVRHVIEQQTSLPQLPLPPNGIFVCLRSCETSLGILNDFVKKHQKNATRASAVTRLKDDIKLGRKAKEINTFEIRIQRDIDNLHASLGTNTTSIL
jgi:ABC-type multidrug transport system fused ATPase/permease subunit